MIVNYFMYNILVEKLFIVGNELLVWHIQLYIGSRMLS